MHRTPTPPRALGALEERVMEALWATGPLTVRDVCLRLRDRAPAYTTVMTTLDRLFKKGLTARERVAGAFVYRPALTRAEFHRRLVEHTVSSLLTRGGDPVLAGFIDAAAQVDEENLARLERLIAARRRSKS